jgi:uncharacterized protein
MLADTDEGVIISLAVLANAPKSEIIGEHNGALKIKIKAPPVDGKANAEIIAFFSGLTGLPKNQIEILRGDKSNKKKILIHGLYSSQIQEVLHKQKKR